MLDRLVFLHSSPQYWRVRSSSLSVSLLFSPAPLHRNINRNENPEKVDDLASSLHSDSRQLCRHWTGLTETCSVVTCNLDCVFICRHAYYSKQKRFKKKNIFVSCEDILFEWEMLYVVQLTDLKAGQEIFKLRLSVFYCSGCCSSSLNITK